MTAEGIFPKIGGDPLYFSEANKFNNDYTLGWLTGSVVSGTAIQRMGSIVVPKDFINVNKGVLELFFNTIHAGTDASSYAYLYCTISGLQNNYQATLAHQQTRLENYQGRAFIQMAINGSLSYQSDWTPGNSQDSTGGRGAYAVGVTAINPGSAFVIFPEFETTGSVSFLNNFQVCFRPVNV